MSTQKIPNSNKQLVQSNQGDYQGNLSATFNCDLDSEPGVIKTSKRLDRVIDDTMIATDIVQALTIHDGDYYIVTNDRVLDCSTNNDPTDSSNWNQVSTLGIEDLGVETDAVSFSGLLLISLGTDIMSWDGTTKDDDWWVTTTSGTALTALYPHTMEVLRTGTDTLFVTDTNTVRYYNSSAGHTTVTLDTLMTANCLTPSLDRMWAGTFTEVEDNAYVYELRVGDDSALQAYAVDGRACLSMFTYRNTPFVITERGYIQAFDGAGFSTVAQFPWANQSKVMEGARPGLVQTSPSSLAIHPKGAKVSGKHAFIFVDTNDEYNGGSLIDPRGYAGVWVLDLETYSLTHRYSLTLASTDHGVSKVARSGPVLITNTPETRIMVGAEVESSKGVWMEGSSTAQGFFVTTRHEADSVQDAFEKVIVKHDTLASGESITVKKQNVIKPNQPVEINDVTWVDGTRFTTTTSTTDIAVGDEVFVLAGYASGKMAHIESIEGSTTATITLDAAIGAATETSDVQIQNFTLVIEDTDTENAEIRTLGPGDTSHFQTYKVVMTGDVTVREVISKSNNKEGL